MLDPQDFALLTAACRWSVFFASRAPRPLFAAPGFLFQLSPTGLPAALVDPFLSRYEVLKHTPERLLQRTAERSQLRSSGGIVLCYALDEGGDIHAEPEQLPEQLLVYLHLPQSATYGRRLLRIDRSALYALVAPDRLLPFDLRFLPTLTSAADPSYDAGGAVAELRVH